MSKYCNILLVFFIMLMLFMCKTTDGHNTIINGDPTKYKIDEKNLDEKKLKEVMEALFNLIEKNISTGNFNDWYDSISKKYKDFINDPGKLKKLSDLSDFLYNRKIILKGPKDYFEYVVVMSREGKTLEFKDYLYIDKNHVQVICLFDKKDKLIYDFIFEDNSWKIDR